MARHLKGDPSLAAETARNTAIGVAAACSEMLSDAAAEASVKLPIDSGDRLGFHSAPSLLHSAHSAPSPHFCLTISTASDFTPLTGARNAHSAPVIPNRRRGGLR